MLWGSAEHGASSEPSLAPVAGVPERASSADFLRGRCPGTQIAA